MVEAVATLLSAGQDADTIRTDVDPAEVRTSLSGVGLSAGHPSQRDRAGRMLNLLTDGLRYRT